MNQTTIAGHMGADPEVRFTSSGQKVTTLRVATKARKDETIWWKVTLWGDQFDNMVPYLKKGSPVICTGELNKPEIFTDREGKPQISVSLTAWHVSFSPFGKPQSQENPTNVAMMAEQTVGQGKTEMAFSDEEIPF
jgi:single-strand DNA-binding protein